MSVPKTVITPDGDTSKIIVGGNHIKLLGPRMYVRKDIAVDQLDGIYIPDQAGMTRDVQGSDKGDLQANWSPRENTDSAVVLALGPEINYTRINGEELHVGSRVVIKSGAQSGVFRSPHYEWDFFLDIDAILAILHDQ